MVEHYNDTVGVVGSSPIPPTIFFVYILKSRATGKYYVGSTDDLDQRLHFHNSGQSHYTARRGSWELVYLEKFPMRASAIARERQIKKWKSRVYIEKLISGNAG